MKTTKTIYRPDHLSFDKIGKTFQAKNGVKYKILAMDYKDAKLRNAAGSLIPMPQTVLTVEVDADQAHNLI
jgi:hypothetical protein